MENNDEVIEAEVVEPEAKPDDGPDFSPEPEPEKKKYTRRYLRAREYRFLKLLQENAKAARPRPQTALLREAGYSPTVRSSKLIKDRISEVISQNDVVRKKFEDAGLGVDSIVDDFTRLRFCEKEGKDGKMLPDNLVQFRVLELRADLLKLRPPKKVQIDERKQIFNITPQVIENLRQVKGDEELRKLLEE